VRLIAHKQIAVASGALVTVADRCLKAPISIHRARPHTVDRLLSIFLALVLRHAGEHVLDEDGV